MELITSLSSGAVGFVDAAGVDPGVADVSLLHLSASMLDLGDAVFSARDGAVGVGGILKGDFAILTSVGEDGLG